MGSVGTVVLVCGIASFLALCERTGRAECPLFFCLEEGFRCALPAGSDVVDTIAKSDGLRQLRRS
jgi:hypothetical protein